MKGSVKPGLNEHTLQEILSCQGAELYALRLLIESMKARGGLIGLAGRPELFAPVGAPAILFMFGEFEKNAVMEEIREFYKMAWARGEQVASVIESGSRYACCSIPTFRDQILGVQLWGGPPAQFEDLSLLMIFTRLVEQSIARYCVFQDGLLDRPIGPKNFPDDYVEGSSLAMKELHATVAALSNDSFPVLLLGETGVGKEHIAQLLHRWSPRSQGPFIAVNCAAIPAELIEAEMFGIDKGVASGVLERPGYFQLADGGTLFLDEVAELQTTLQAKLLRVLQESEIRRVGGSLDKVNLRIVAATNADLKRRLEDQRFRQDLYYRLAGFELCIPALRERKEDLPLFVEHYLRLFTRTTGKVIKGMTFQAFERFMEYSWPGNVRELMHELHRLVCICPTGEAISPAMLSAHILAPTTHPTKQNGLHSSLQLEPQLADLERRLISEALVSARGNHSQAARLLGISRNGLAIKLERLGIKH